MEERKGTFCVFVVSLSLFYTDGNPVVFDLFDKEDRKEMGLHVVGRRRT